MFTALETHEHVYYPRGVMCVDCAEFMPAELDRCLACGSDAVALVEEGWDESGAPHPGYSHHVEIDVSTGMVGYTRLSTAERAERKAMDEKYHAAERAFERERELGLDLIRTKAADDPGFAALAKYLGIALK